MAYELVVIGASAGGLAAVGALLSALPQGFPLPVAIVQHRSASPLEGNLAAVWQQQSVLPVHEAEDKTPLLPGHVYIAPADYHLLVETRGYLALSTEPPVLWARPSIDVLFESAADAYGNQLIGVVLTGASADGSQGLRTIRSRGGCALVQTPASAECDVMPRAALSATAVNHVLDVEALGRIIGALANPSAGAR